MRFYKQLLSFLAVLIFISYNIFAATCDSISVKLMEQTWREFRNIHPFNFQTVGLKHYGDTCVFVMSEPAEWVKAEEINDLFSEYGGLTIIGRKSFGYDGGLYDVVGYAFSDSEDFKNLENRLFKLLYGTAYKPYYTDLDNPYNHVYYSDTNLDYPVLGLSQGWDEKFIVPSQEDTVMDHISLTKGNKSNELYYSSKRGFLLWIINPKEITTTDTLFRSNARKFALDTDLIVHSHLKDGNLYVVGRERIVPITELPPLRGETICSIIKSGGSSNSLIINPDHGEKIVVDSVSVCWATPILMNRSLRNTELGNLMFLTDLMLKSWSENGEIIDYFVDYPRPTSFFTQNGVANELGYQPKYMWGCGNLDRTGCLLPIYTTKSDSAPKTEAEKELCCKAYDYFAKLNNVDLVRINQYAHFFCYNEEVPNNYSGIPQILRLPSVPIRSLSAALDPDDQDDSEQTADQKDSESNGFQGGWIQTPTLTVSNNPWGFGGFPPKLKKLKIPKRVPPIRPIRNGFLKGKPGNLIKPEIQTHPIGGTSSSSLSLGHGMLGSSDLIKALREPTWGPQSNKNPSHQTIGREVAPIPTRDESVAQKYVSWRTKLIDPSSENAERGFVPSQHNIAPKQAFDKESKNDIKTDKTSLNWKERLREKVNNKIHKINSKESKGDFYMIYGYILKLNEDGKCCINSAA